MPYARTFSSDAVAADLGALFCHQLSACGLSQGELCVCVTDTAWSPSYGAACHAAALSLGAEAVIATVAWDRPPASAVLSSICDRADLIVYATAHALHYRGELRAALDRGARALCVMEPPHVLDRLRADTEVREKARAGATLLEGAREIRVTSPAGTDLVMDKTGRRGLALYGAADAPGRLDFWGLGAVQAAQLEGTTEGRLVLDRGDCVFRLARYVEAPVTMVFEAGRVVAIEGGLDAALIRAELETAGDDGAFRAGHMGWGVDRRARWTQPLVQTPEAGCGGADIESAMGVVQIELGSNDDIAFGGTNRSRAHLGLCMRGATLLLDGQAIVADGAIVPRTR
jgi:2,5-dihydroxypyridine 5,6-dioxygenase